MPNVACVERRLFGKNWFLWDPPRHLWHFDAGSLAGLCRSMDLEVVRSGHDTIANLAPSLYRALELRGWSRLAATLRAERHAQRPDRAAQPAAPGERGVGAGAAA